MQPDGATLNMVVSIFWRVIEPTLQASSPRAAHVDMAVLHIGAVAFIHRFGSSLNAHVLFHVSVVDGVLEAVVGEAGGQGSRTTASLAAIGATDATQSEVRSTGHRPTCCTSHRSNS